jgi:valyl-tRNA synthetase
MDSKYVPANYEEKLNTLWEKKEFFKAKVDPSKKPFSIILPPPNANGSLHVGHVVFIYEDIMIRYHKLLGEQVLWLLGLDHAGIETQFVFE